MKNIVFDNVEKAYGKNVIVKDLNLEIKEGERLILLGPSGCGKSTTLRMIAGLENITAGNLYMGGELMNEVPSGKRDVSMVFQNYALFPHMTVEGNITYGLKVHKLPKEEISKRLQDVIEMLDLSGLEKRKPKDLSGGQRQRVALARAIVKQAGYFLLDEPLSNLDAQLRLKARTELVKIHERFHQTLVYVTHDQIEAMTVGNRIALMNKGKIQMLDTPGNVYHHPANVFTAKFIGSPSMNIVKTQWAQGYLHIGSQKIQLPDMWNEIAAVKESPEFYLGIRPEHVVFHKEEMTNALKGTVKYMEDYGNKVAVYVEIEGNEIISVVDFADFTNGNTVYLSPDFSKIHLFSCKNEENVGYPEAIRKESKVLKFA